MVSAELLSMLLQFHGDHELCLTRNDDIDNCQMLVEQNLLTQTFSSPFETRFRITHTGFVLTSQLLGIANQTLQNDRS